MFKLYVLLVLFFRGYGSLLYANPGHNVTLPCFYNSGSQLCWYKQVAGEQPQIIASFYKSSHNIFYNQFKDDKRFSVHTGEGVYHLHIASVRESDSAMYFCGQTGFPVPKFDQGIFLVLNDSNRRSFLKQPASDSVQPGGSVTLNCTLHSGTGDGEHSVYWFKKDSQNSNLGILYVHENSSSECVKSPESPAQCVYSLSKRNVSLSDAGTYYCAVASCGKILYGKGTRLDVGGEQHTLKKKKKL
ncbi:uncharacterized protein LOC115589443 [Sparus aurata]|uniref:Uncharacterized LOC115589443 n=1 Tax=Sparus aurata TaxID=8175 RepID=A0A671Y2G2_SPAAU|nr:uncharacterized protein LOC115589443 [Sparus aurata]